MNEITLGQTVLRAAFGGDCLKFDGRKSQEIRERKMSRISDTGTLRPMHGTQSGCFYSETDNYELEGFVLAISRRGTIHFSGT